MAAHGGPNIPTDGLILNVDAGNQQSYPGSGTKWIDVSGNSRSGNILNGASITTDRVKCFSFDGVNDMITLDNSRDLAWLPDGSLGLPEFTIDMWIKSSDTGGMYYTKPWNSAGQYNIWIYSNGFYIRTNTTKTISFGRHVSNGTWTNIVCWANATQMGYYINYDEYSGSQNHNLSSILPPNGNNRVPTGLMTLYPYGSGWGGNTGFSILGLLSSCKIYDRVLTADEVKQNFSATRGRYGL